MKNSTSEEPGTEPDVANDKNEADEKPHKEVGGRNIKKGSIIYNLSCVVFWWGGLDGVR